MAQKTTTLWGRWKANRAEASKETEAKYLNPLGVRVDGQGDVVSIDSLDWREFDFNVRQFRVLTRNIGGQEFPMTDYFLRHRPLDESGDIEVVLRYVPLPDPDGDLTHQVFLLRPQSEFGYDETVMNVLKANSGFSFFIPGASEQWVEEAFPTRVDDVSLPYDCEVDMVRDVDGDGDVHDDEVLESRLTYWDFWRTSTNEETGEDFVEYLFVEVAEADGWATQYLGTEIEQAIVVKV